MDCCRLGDRSRKISHCGEHSNLGLLALFWIVGQVLASTGGTSADWLLLEQTEDKNENGFTLLWLVLMVVWWCTSALVLLCVGLVAVVVLAGANSSVFVVLVDLHGGVVGVLLKNLVMGCRVLRLQDFNFLETFLWTLVETFL